MTLWVDIHVGLMFIVIGLQMEDLGGINVGHELSHQPYSSWVAWGSRGLKKVLENTHITYLTPLGKEMMTMISLLHFCLISVGYHTYVTWVENDTLIKML
jgi:hypothetical protein